LIQNFENTIDNWVETINSYNFEFICLQPSPTEWSLGQVCTHLLDETAWYLEQVEVAVSAHDNSEKEMTPEGKGMFINNSFPDEKLRRPGDSTNMPFPGSKEQLLSGFSELKDKIRDTEKLVSESTAKGKTQHPGLGYFNAEEWLQFAEMHFRHHLKQKKRIEDFLKTVEQD